MRWLKTALLLANILAGPANAAWRKAESAHFRVYANLSADALRQRVKLLEDYRNLLGLFTTGKVEDDAPKLPIYIVDDIARTAPFGKVDPALAGFYSASDDGLAAFSTKGAFGQKVLLHEYAHHHMFAASTQAYPAWYVEGFADFFMTAQFFPKQVDFGQVDPNNAYVLTMPWLKWDRVIGRDGTKLRGNNVFLFYAQSWLLTHYMFRAPGMSEKLTLYLNAVASGTDQLEAFRTHVLSDTSRLDGLLQAYWLKLKFTRVTRKAPEPAAVTVTDLPASADTMIMLHAWLDNRGGAADDPKAALAKVQAAAAPYPDDPLAGRTLAMAERQWGDKARALALVNRQLAATPDEPDLLRLKADILLASDRVANRSEARRLLARAVKLAPNDWRAMHLYVHTQDIVHDELDDNSFNIVQRTWELAPQVAGVVVDFASVLARRNRLPDSAKILESVVFSPHGGGSFTRFAAALRDAALSGDAAAFVKAFDAGPPKPDPPAEAKPQ